VTFGADSQLSQIDEEVFASCSSLKSIVIPKNIRILVKSCFADCSSLSSVVFESDSKLEIIESHAFSGCIALDSLCLPASLTVLSENALSEIPLLKSLTFEPRSKLTEIRGSAFSSCESLKSVSFPPSLSSITASAFLQSSVEEIRVDSATSNSFISGQFLIGVDGMRLIRYFGDREDLECGFLCELGLVQIGLLAFSDCSTLKSICIPASIEIISEHCFSECRSLSKVVFESGSRLRQMGPGLFTSCPALTSICVPARVECIPETCFAFCTALIEVSFESGSQLTRIDRGAFMCCHSLRSLVVPTQLEIMARGIFWCCTSLCELMFELPSHLKQLDLPPSEFGSLCIPDSVEIVFGNILKSDGRYRLLQFSRRSCLMKIELRALMALYGPNETTELNSFVDLSEEVLRRFRCQFEYF
jgi:hypothetical protein